MNFLDCTDVRDFLAENRDDGTQLWVLHHLARTGGSSLSTALGWRLHPNFNVHIPAERFAEEDFDSDPPMELAFRQFWDVQKTMPFRFVSGHLLRPHIAQLRTLPYARILTIIRDPVQQILSLYRYHQSPASPEHQGFVRRYRNFDSFIEDPERQNRIAHFIGGEGAGAEQCQDILRRDYLFCGVFEQMPVCLAMIGSLLGFDVSGHMLHFNVAAPASREVEEGIAPYRDKILSLNAVDAAIYRFVDQRFHERLARMPEYLKADGAQHATQALEWQHAVGERNVRRLLAELDDRQRTLAAADKDLRRLIGEVEERNGRLAAADKDLRRLIGEVEERDGRLAAADKELRRLIGEVEERDGRLAAADKELRRLIGEVEERNGRLAAADKELRRLVGEVEERDGRLAAADKDLRRLAGEVEERDRRFADADSELRRVIGELEDRDRRLSAAGQDLRRLIGELADRDRQLADADSELRRVIGELENRNRRLSAVDKDVRRLIGDLEDRNRRLADADKELRRRIGEIPERGVG